MFLFSPASPMQAFFLLIVISAQSKESRDISNNLRQLPTKQFLEIP